MDAFEVLTKEINEKVQQLQTFVADGSAKNFEEYKSICGEIKGLLTAKSYTFDLKQRMESADE